MSFELRQRDLLGRIGRLKTKNGVVETPAFLPVVNPTSQVIPPRRMREEFNCDIVITNAYIIERNFGEKRDLDVHKLLDYDGVVATDSGAYQILKYGEVETTATEILNFQKSIGSDIAVILDHPTGWGVSRSRAEYTVDRTLRHAREAVPLIGDDKTLWVGPVQGGEYLDLIERSAREMSELPFPIHALGSPTPVMERYLFPLLVDMIMSAKLNLPPNRPLHLFGAGHPMMFPLAVALGCDMFDSAAYALFARDERYLLSNGTVKLGDLDYLPCSCPICRSHDAGDLKEMPRRERVKTLTEHNLYVSMAEMDGIKQALASGTLWELLESRSRVHPALKSALKGLTKYRNALERGSPSYGGRGVSFYDSSGLARPEITRHINRMESNYLPPLGTDKLLLAPAPSNKPYSRSKEHERLVTLIKETVGEGPSHGFHLCYYDVPFGAMPSDLCETFPLSQFETAEPPDVESIEFSAAQVNSYLKTSVYSAYILHSADGRLDGLIEESLGELKKEGKIVAVNSNRDPWGDEALQRLRRLLSQFS